MKKILLVCGAGMSTSLLVKNMQREDMQNQCHIKCCDTMSAQVVMIDYDIFLLAPHIAYMKEDFKPKCEAMHMPFMVIDTLDYTKMDGKTVLHKAITMLQEYEKEHPFKVLLLHSHGGAMSDLIVIDMKKKSIDEEKNWIIEAMPVDRFLDDGSIDIILLEPQIRFEEESIKKRLQNEVTLLEIPSINLYATFDGRKILDYIHHIYEERKQQKKEKMKEGFEDI